MIGKITKETLKLYAANVYNNPGCVSHREFEEDYARIKSLKTLLNKYLNNKNPNIKIIINHIICISNVFPGESMAVILFTDYDESIWNVLSTFLVFLNLMPVYPINIENRMIDPSKFCIDDNLLEKLRNI